MKSGRSRSVKGPEEVFWRIEVEVLPGKLQEFHALVRELIASSEQEPGTLEYDWFFDAENKVCHTYERYQDSAAVAQHTRTFGAQFAERFTNCCRQIGLDVCGNPNETAKTLLGQYGANFFTKWSGFNPDAIPCLPKLSSR